MNRTSMWRVAALVLALAVSGSACSSDGDKEGSQSTSTGQQAPASKVAEELGKLNALVAQIGLAASVDAKAAKERVAEVDKLWEPIEATVKEKDNGLYDRLEGGFAALKKAVEAEDFAQAQGAATDLAEAVKAYLKKFPG